MFTISLRQNIWLVKVVFRTTFIYRVTVLQFLTVKFYGQNFNNKTIWSSLMNLGWLSLRNFRLTQKLHHDNSLKSKRYLSDRAHLKWHHNAERDNPSPKTNLVSRLNENFQIPDDAQRVREWQRFERFQSWNSMVPSDVSLNFFLKPFQKLH